MFAAGLHGFSFASAASSLLQNERHSAAVFASYHGTYRNPNRGYHRIADRKPKVEPFSVRAGYGTLTGSKFSFQGSPWTFSSDMKGSGSNSSHVWTPLVVHLPSKNIFAPIIAGTPVV